MVKKNFKFYATVKPKEIFIKFLLKYEIENRLSENRTEAYAESEGEILLDIDNYEIKDFRNLGEEFAGLMRTEKRKKVKIFIV